MSKARPAQPVAAGKARILPPPEAAARRAAATA
jgi:hypothetical protein